jgi:hypothetical protein
MDLQMKVFIKDHHPMKKIKTLYSTARTSSYDDMMCQMYVRDSSYGVQEIILEYVSKKYRALVYNGVEAYVERRKLGGLSKIHPKPKTV